MIIPLAGQVPSNGLDNNSGIDGDNTRLLQRTLHASQPFCCVTSMVGHPILLPGEAGAVLEYGARVYTHGCVSASSS